MFPCSHVNLIIPFPHYLLPAISSQQKGKRKKMVCVRTVELAFLKQQLGPRLTAEVIPGSLRNWIIGEYRQQLGLFTSMPAEHRKSTNRDENRQGPAALDPTTGRNRAGISNCHRSETWSGLPPLRSRRVFRPRRIEADLPADAGVPGVPARDKGLQRRRRRRRRGGGRTRRRGETSRGRRPPGLTEIGFGGPSGGRKVSGPPRVWGFGRGGRGGVEKGDGGGEEPVAVDERRGRRRLPVDGHLGNGAYRRGIMGVCATYVSV
ncbi:hypothetical protein BHE74_00054113 [Ensete ventricosum]|nr:hypothetical protein BHE74_00054113 [Ensete ventricosum]